MTGQQVKIRCALFMIPVPGLLESILQTMADDQL